MGGYPCTVVRGAAGADMPCRADISALDAPALILSCTGYPAHPTETATELARLSPRAVRHTASAADRQRRQLRHVQAQASSAAAARHSGGDRRVGKRAHPR
ncbi:hypothetical protein GCM10023320_08930 [Pseudonocardia adelaidensis]|uniref:Uncharacterized protein n=1 Tax=Pseudonocardia adelaidensis TaxID=648754 RepID=A0ABP9NAR4_9PSEU